LPEKNTNQVSSQDPTVCQAHVQPECIRFVFHPAIPAPRRSALNEHGIRDKDNQSVAHRPKPADCELVYPTNTVRLLRKEVIQPHLPVRLPCYDFVPIASPTFDNSLPQAG
jgi:hypothetical protein